MIQTLLHRNVNIYDGLKIFYSNILIKTLIQIEEKSFAVTVYIFLNMNFFTKTHLCNLVLYNIIWYPGPQNQL